MPTQLTARPVRPSMRTLGLSFVKKHFFMISSPEILSFSIIVEYNDICQENIINFAGLEEEGYAP